MPSHTFVLPPPLTTAAPQAAVPNEIPDLLRQLLAAQQEQLAVLKAQAAQQDAGAKWKAFLARWSAEFPGVGGAAKRALPLLERAHLALVRDLTDQLADDPDLLGDEFALAEFLDKYGLKLVQLGNIVAQLAPLAEAANDE
jgi:hypothetical protein